MAFFALGTVPGLFGIGGLSAFFNPKKSRVFFPVAGVIIVIFALFNLHNGFKLIRVGANGLGAGGQNQTTNVRGGAKNNAATDESANPGANNAADIQIVNMTESGSGYAPNEFTIIKDKPVRWIITADAPYSCASSLIMPALNIRKQLESGENTIDFTPPKAATCVFPAAWACIPASSMSPIKS